MAANLIGDVFGGRFFNRFVERSPGVGLFLIRPRRNGDRVNFAARVRLRADPVGTTWRDFDGLRRGVDLRLGLRGNSLRFRGLVIGDGRQKTARDESHDGGAETNAAGPTSPG